jgi:phospholipase/carboxylesterase/glyoxalase family protein
MSDATQSPASADFVHRWVQGTRSDLTLLLLHGTGGDENDLLPLGPMIAPGAGLLSPRGRVLENGLPRFFRRIAEGVFDVPDLVVRIHELAAFVVSASARYGFDARRVVAAGFSNGANLAAGALLLRPELLAGAVLLRPMVPLEPEAPPALGGKPVLIAAGRNDPVVPPGQSEALAEMLRRAGAAVELNTSNGGHGLEPADLRAAREWMGRNFPP